MGSLHDLPTTIHPVTLFAFALRFTMAAQMPSGRLKR